ncbi:MAG: pilus assembly protein PilM [Planctomycetes bacterium]|nr:pilus assembly protein PilM [Planctomycetota bacterium]
MALQRTSVGIDIGTHSIKVVQLKISESGAFIQNALYFDRAALHSRGVDPQDRVAVAALLKSQMSEHRIPTRGVVLSISGSDSMLRYTSIPPVPSWRLKIIMEYEVKEVAEKIGEKLASDFRVLQLPRESTDDQVILIGLSKEENLEKILSDLEAAGIYVSKAVPAPLALYAAYNAFGPKADPDSPEDDLSVVVDLGRSNLSLALVLNNNLAYARSVTFGGESFTELVARDLGVEAERAEALKIREGTVDIESHRSRVELVNALRGGAAQLLNLIQSSLRFCRTQTGAKLPEPTRIVLLGGGSRLRGLDRYLHQALKRPVEIFHPSGVMATGALVESAADVFKSYPGDFAVPLGLAALGVQEHGFSLSILPSRYRERRLFWDRTVFLYAAGAFLLAALLSGLSDAFLLNSDANQVAESLDKARKDLESRKSEMDGNIYKNTRSRERLNRLLREIEVSTFQTFLSDALKKHLRAEVRLSRLKLEAELDGDGSDFNYALILEGLADNADRKGLEVIEDVRQRLKSESRIAAVDVGGVKEVGINYEFRMVIKPSFQSY